MLRVPAVHQPAPSRVQAGANKPPILLLLGCWAKLWAGGGHADQGCWEAVVLPAWDGSKTALAGSKSGLGQRKSGDLGALCRPI